MGWVEDLVRDAVKKKQKHHMPLRKQPRIQIPISGVLSALELSY